MKAIPQLLSCLLVASVAMLGSGATLGDVPANKRQIKSPAKGEVKRARQARAETKNVVNTEVPPSTAQPTAQLATPAATQAVTQAAAQPAAQAVTHAAAQSATRPPAQATLQPAARPMPASAPETVTAVVAPDTVAVNPYSPGAFAVNKGAVANPYLTKSAIVAVPPAPSISLVQAPAAPAPVKLAVTPAPVVASVPIAAPTPAPVVVAAPVAAKTVVEPAVAPSAAVTAPAQPIPTEVASAKAWAKIVAGPAATPVAPAAPVVPSSNPYLTYRTSYTQAAPTLSAPTQAAPRQAASAPASPAADPSQLVNSLRNLLPDLHLPSPDIDVLPSITKVFPTGERPMYVLTFKCPTELVGLTPPPTKALRWLITSGMESINSTNLLPFSMQQVCQ